MCVKLLPPNKKETKQNQSRLHKTPISTQWRIQDFKLGGDALKKIAPSGGRGEIFLEYCV